MINTTFLAPQGSNLMMISYHKVISCATVVTMIRSPSPCCPCHSKALLPCHGKALLHYTDPIPVTTNHLPMLQVENSWEVNCELGNCDYNSASSLLASLLSLLLTALVLS